MTLFFFSDEMSDGTRPDALARSTTRRRSIKLPPLLNGHPRMITRRETFDASMLQRSLRSCRRKSVFVL